MYRIQLELNDATDTARAASYLDLHLKIDSEDWLWNKRDDFNFPIVKCLLYVATFQQHQYMEHIFLYSVNIVF